MNKTLKTLLLTSLICALATPLKAESSTQSSPKTYSPISKTKGIRSVTTEQPLIALTFDDGPTDITPQYLDLFKEKGVKATFFWKGNAVKGRPAIARRLLEEGHEIGNHSYSHPRFNLIPHEEAHRQVHDTQDIIEATTGFRPTLFRAPYILYTEQLDQIIKNEALLPIGCSVGVSDWREETTVESIIERATSEKIKAGTIILMHDWSPKSLAALPDIIDTLHAKGFKFVTISDLIRTGEPVR